MATHAIIALEYPDNTVRGVYLNNDVYVKEAGFILQAFYSNPNAVQALLNLGHLNTLGVRLGEKTDMCNRTALMQHQGQCLAYNRDGVEAYGIYQEVDWNAFRRRYAEDYIYLYRCKDNTWYVRSPKMAKLAKLVNVLHTTDLCVWKNRFADGRNYTPVEIQVGKNALRLLRTTR